MRNQNRVNCRKIRVFKLKNIIRTIFILAIVMISAPVFSTEYYVVNNLDRIFKPTKEQKANAMCFFYQGNKYKCVCMECKNLKVWASGDISKIKGFSVDRIYGVIPDCK